MKKITFLVCCLLTNAIAFAQWTDDTSLNTLVASDNPEINMTRGGTNGYTYTVFWNNLPGEANYDLRLQILDPDGNRLFAPEGEIISASIPMGTYTVTSTLQLDADNNIYVGVTGTTSAAAYVFKLDAQGNNLWGSDGLNVGSGYMVRALPMSNGDVVISWYDNDGIGQIQRFDESGNPVWATPVGIQDYPPAQSFELSDGGFITLYHHKLSFGIVSVMYAQRYDADGVAQWEEPLPLFDTNYNTAYNREYSAMQIGDDVYIAYQLTHNNRFDAYIQRISPDGTLPWGLQGTDFDIAQADYEMEISMAHTAGSDNIWAICRYTDPSQSQIGIYVQKIDKNTGERLLGENAKMVFPLSNPGVQPMGQLELYNDQPMFLTRDGNTLNAVLLDASGDFAWPEETEPMATWDAEKNRIRFTKISETEFVTVFREDKGSGHKLFAQRLKYNPTGISELNPETDIRFENPVPEILRLNATGEIVASVVVYDATGRMIDHIEGNKTNELLIHTQTWKSGLYFGVVKTGNGNRQTIKMLKM